LPATLFLLLRDSAAARSFGQWSRAAKVIFSLIVIAVLIALYFYLFYSSFFFRFNVVPPIHDIFTVQGYTWFSGKHLLDLVNLLFLMVPGLLIALVLLLHLDWKHVLASPEGRYLLWLVVPVLVAGFLLSPGLGMPRDWDLFCFVGVPLNLLIYYLLLTKWGGGFPSRVAALLAISFSLIILAPRVATQAIPAKGLEVFYAYADLDPMRSHNGRYWAMRYLEEHGTPEQIERRAKLNALALPHEQRVQRALEMGRTGRLQEAISSLRQAIAEAPNYSYAWSNLGVIYEWSGNLDSALICLKIAGALRPHNPDTYDNTARVYADLENWSKAEEFWKRSLEIDSTRYNTMLSLADLYDHEGRTAKRDSLLNKISSVDRLSLRVLQRLTVSAIRREDWARASIWLKRSFTQGEDSAAVAKVLEQYPELSPPW
jgi:tetratricopeptide (TPR) repeat protein